jgi:NADH dehydrogenase FAD-containing subunit/uncharacterized membrane protein YphA (DoxX/SURF4 family)/class 3 adenylate cyclase
MKDQSIHQRFWPALFLVIGLFGMTLFSDTILAHERWILTPEQISYWNSLKHPDLFSRASTLNSSMITVFLVLILGWVWLGFTGAREMFPDLQARLSSYGDHVPRILRVCLGWILLSSAFGVEPRFGIDPFTVPTFLAPDLDIQQLGDSWAWLRWAEIVLGLTILFGLYVRIFAALLIVLCLLGGYLYGLDILAYAGAIIGACIYLVLQGPGRHYVPLPILPICQKVQDWLAEQPRQRAQAIMRILTGTTLLYLGVFFKVNQPNLSIGIITEYQLPILSSNPEVFTLVMALVEVSAGILMIAGILLRPLSLFLISAFTIFAVLLPETPTAHILFYGVVLTCFINSAGHLHRPIARDKPAHIVIVGGGLAALQAAIKIERLIGQYSNIKITLLHDQANFLFAPFLPEVVGGTVQPGNVVNPFRRIIQQTSVVVGRLDLIDEGAQKVIVKRKNNEMIELDYDSLIIAPSLKSNISNIPGMIVHSCPIDTVADALRIRQRVLDLVEEAEFNEDPAEQVRLLTFAIFGFGECASGIAVEISRILRAAEPSYSVLRDREWKVHLYEDKELNWSSFEKEINPDRALKLKKAGVIEHLDLEIASITQREVFFADGQSQPIGLVINASLQSPPIPFKSRGSLILPYELNDRLCLEGSDNIFITEKSKNHDDPQFTFTDDLVSLGYTAGLNAWAHSQGYPVRSFVKRNHFIQPYNMGKYSLCRIGWFVFSGKPAWFVSRWINLLSVPGLERNLRIIIDWFLVMIFRSDIAVLSQATTSHLQRSHFKASDEVFRQGDPGEFAYAVDSGHLRVIQDGRQVREVGPGDFFGELTPIHQNRRGETVRCLTDCELKIVSQEDLGALLKSGWLMGKAIRNLKTYQSDTVNPEVSLGLKRLTYVSKLNAVLDEEQILTIGKLASINNRKMDVTGTLISVRDYFFQILEGEEATVDQLIEKISRDPRHSDVTILSSETGCEERLFTEWGMKTVALSESNDLMLLAISLMLQNIAHSYNTIGRYTQPVLLKYLMEGVNPLTIPVRSIEKIVVSGSMTEFSVLARQYPTERAVEMVNQFLEICSASYIAYGGQVAKYSGGCVVGHFEKDQLNAAIAASVDAFNKFKVLSQETTIDGSVNCGFGMSFGEMVEGNIGSSIKMDYTVLGSTVEQSINLSMIARDINKAVAVNESIKGMTDTSWSFEHSEDSSIKHNSEAMQVYVLSETALG